MKYYCLLILITHLYLSIETKFNKFNQDACLTEISKCPLPSYDINFLSMLALEQDSIALRTCPALACLSKQDNLTNYEKCLARNITQFNPDKPDIDSQIAEPFSACEIAHDLDGQNHD